MNAISPMQFSWNGEAMVPLRPKLADKVYCIGEEYYLAPVEERSLNSHRHYFAAVKEAWRNLPDELAERFPSPDHLRRYALIRTGYCNIQEFAAASKAEAIRLRAFLVGFDDYSVVVAIGNSVKRMTAKSQSYKEMPKDEFQKSKQDTLDYLASLIGTKAQTLSENAGAAA